MVLLLTHLKDVQPDGTERQQKLQEERKGEKWHSLKIKRTEETSPSQLLPNSDTNSPCILNFSFPQIKWGLTVA